MDPQVAVRLVGDVAIVDMTGRFTLGDGCALLRDTVKQLLESGHKHILISLRGVTYIDSSGLGQMAGCYVTASRIGAQIKILNARSKVSDMLQVTRLFSTIFVIFSDEDEAVRSFQPS
jgi:anti-sigma B factor antagonist